MNFKHTSGLLMGFAVIAVLSVPVLAAGINARVKSVDLAAHTLTVIEGGKDFAFAITDATKFVDAKGNILEPTAEELKTGTRLSITYEKQNDASVASEIKLRDLGK